MALNRVVGSVYNGHKRMVERMYSGMCHHHRLNINIVTFSVINSPNRISEDLFVALGESQVASPAIASYNLCTGERNLYFFLRIVFSFLELQSNSHLKEVRQPRTKKDPTSVAEPGVPVFTRLFLKRVARTSLSEGLCLITHLF
jgi:hypothetical protein